jgi:AraC-like DNA-binding protein
VLDLLSVPLAARLGSDRRVSPDSRRRALLERIQGFTEQHLPDAGLPPGTVAGAHHVSLRYLHKLFEAEQATVAEWIRRRRLEHCRRDLLDPVLGERPVSAIASRWGLANPTHFSHAFRAAYGVTPLEYRRTADGEPGPRC